MDGTTAAATLGVSPTATKDDIRRAFRARVKALHPDAGGAGTAADFDALRAAFEVLAAAAPTVSAAPRPQFFSPPPVPVVSLVDRRDVVAPARPVARRTRRSTAPVPGRRVGRTFDDHLAAALAAS